MVQKTIDRLEFKIEKMLDSINFVPPLPSLSGLPTSMLVKRLLHDAKDNKSCPTCGESLSISIDRLQDDDFAYIGNAQAKRILFCCLQESQDELLEWQHGDNANCFKCKKPFVLSNHFYSLTVSYIRWVYCSPACFPTEL